MALAFGEHRQVNTPSKRWHFSLWLIAGAHPAHWGSHTRYFEIHTQWRHGLRRRTPCRLRVNLRVGYRRKDKEAI